MTDDDWFERALRELDESEESADREASVDDDGSSASRGDESGSTNGDTSADSDASEPGDEPGTATDNGSDGSAATGPGESSVPAPDEDPFGGVRTDDGGARPSGQSAGSDPFGGGGDDPFGGGGDDPFGGGGDDPFGGGGDDPFGGGGDEFGFADFDGAVDSEPSGFDESETEFDSELDRIRIGIDGLDEMILGGVPERSLMSVIGSAGTGKTTFALQFLNEAVESGGKAVYISLEESREGILSTAEEKGWPFREYADDGDLAVVALDPIEMANSLASIRNDLSRLIADFGADRLVLDSVSLLEMMYDHPSKRRSEVFDFTRSLKESGVTTLLTSEASDDNSYASRYGIVEYLTDAVFVLQYVRPSDFQETRLAIEIQKIRDANHSRETKPYEITSGGISVYRQANIF
ncbi:KaiC domain-containing protein [Halorubrum sp. DTA98]|uniref:KaiC domain-containing protein n=1 Tax=Halorubrum sp. DTA98 TaxID=3402163 RepID=UPI003AAAA748